MHEIEIKAKLEDKGAVQAKLEALGCVFDAPVRQLDVIFVEKIGPVETYYSNKRFLRIRECEGGDTLFTLKYHHGPRGDDPNSVPLEHELKISSKEEMENIIKALGYQEAVRKDKVRITAHYKDWEICIDEVKTLGSYIELEKMGNEGEIDDVQKSMKEFLQELGIPESAISTDRYDILLLQKAEESR